jgi:hypothetical protein
MNTAEYVTTAACATSLLLGAGSLTVAREALRGGWVRGSVSLGLVGPAKRWESPRTAEKAAPAQGSAEDGSDVSPAPAAPVRAA